MRILCIITREWGEKVFVDNKLYTIDSKDGSLELPDETAAKLLLNKNKYVDPEAPVRTPGKRRSAALDPVPSDDLPPVVLKDPRTGRILTDDETREELAKAHAAVESNQITAKPVDDLKAASDTLGQAHGGGRVTAGEGAASDPLAVQVGQGKAAEVDQEIQDGHPEPGDEQLPPEAAPADWPEVSMENSRPELLALCTRLEHAGWELNKGNNTKKDLLEAIQSGYDAMDAEG